MQSKNLNFIQKSYKKIENINIHKLIHLFELYVKKKKKTEFFGIK